MRGSFDVRSSWAASSRTLSSVASRSFASFSLAISRPATPSPVSTLWAMLAAEDSGLLERPGRVDRALGDRGEGHHRLLHVVQQRQRSWRAARRSSGPSVSVAARSVVAAITAYDQSSSGPVPRAMSMKAAPATPNWRRIETCEIAADEGPHLVLDPGDGVHALVGIDHDAADLAGARAQDLHLGAGRQARDAFVGQQDAQGEGRLEPVLEQAGIDQHGDEHARCRRAPRRPRSRRAGGRRRSSASSRPPRRHQALRRRGGTHGRPGRTRPPARPGRR